MRRYRDPKAPDIDVLARHYLWRGLSKLPDVTKHIADAGDVEKMGMWELLKRRGAALQLILLVRREPDVHRSVSLHSWLPYRGQLDHTRLHVVKQ
jgi:hypothetical protein